MTTPEQRTGKIKNNAARNKFRWLLGALCAVIVLLEFFVHREPHFDQENFFGFYALFGLAASSACILAANFLGRALKTRADYYDDDVAP